MDDEPEVIRQQMDETRSSLTDKIEKLEHQVVGTVQSTTAAVTNTVESVKSAVQETVETVKSTVSDTVGTVKETVGDTVSAVKETLDVRGYVEQYPWASFGTAVAVGYVGGCLLTSGGRARADRITALHSHGGTTYSPGRTSYNGGVRPERGELESAAREARFTAAPAHAEPSWVGKLGSQFAPEIDRLKGLALGALGAMVRDLLTRQAPGQLGSQISGLVDDFTRKLGGEPIRGSILPADPAGGKSSRDREAVSEAHAARASAGL